MKHYGLIGYPLSHSYSEKYFSEKFKQLHIDADYKNFEIESLDDLKTIVKENNLSGFNVTIPYKEKIIPLLDKVTEDAKEVGAVNCVHVFQNKWIGYNTDILGFQESLLNFIPNTNMKALIFGTGGAAKAVSYVLEKLNIPFLLVSRNEIQDAITYADINETLLNEHKLLINTTPVGMYPDTHNFLPIPFHLFSKKHFAYDVIYNPEQTLFLKACESAGGQIKNGLQMLHLQAEAAYTIFNQNE